MESTPVNRRRPVQWFSLRRMALMLDFDAQTVRAWWKAGRFGPPVDGRAEDYFFTVGTARGADVRISSRGYEYFLAHHTQSNVAPDDVVVSGRTQGEARRELVRLAG